MDSGESYQAEAREDRVGEDPWKDEAWQALHFPHDEEEVHHQLDEEDHKDGKVKVGETLGTGNPEAVWGEVGEEEGDVEDAVGDPNHQAATSQGEPEAAPGWEEALKCCIIQYKK